MEKVNYFSKIKINEKTFGCSNNFHILHRVYINPLSWHVPARAASLCNIMIILNNQNL